MIIRAMSLPARASRATRLSSILLASLLLCPIVYAADTPAPYEGVDPGAIRDIDLRGGRIIEPLPFDVQFYLQAIVSTDLVGATGRYKGSKRPQTCEQLFGRAERASTATKYLCETQSDCNKLPPAPRPGEAAGAAQARAIPREDRSKQGLEGDIAFVRLFHDEEAKAEENKQKVELSVPEILPNRHYCFEFTLEDKVHELQEFRERVRADIDGELKGRAVKASEEEYNKLRQKLITAILDDLRPDETLQAQARSFFDPRSSLWEVGQNFLAEFNTIIEKQLQRDKIIENLDSSSRLDVEDALKAVISDKVFVALGSRGGIRLARLEILRLTEDQIGALVEGLAKQRLQEVWQPDQVEARLQQVAAMRQNLELLVPEVRRIGGDPSQREFFSSGGSQLAKEDFQNLNRLMTGADFALETVADELTELQIKLEERAQGIETMAGKLDKQLTEVVRIQATTEANYETRAGWYLSADVGLGYAPDIDDVFTYIGTNIYFRPVNKKARLRGSFWKRFSIMVGVTVDNPEEADKDITGVLMDRSLLLAGGIRISDHFRLSLGTVVFEEANPDPLISREELAWTPFVSASVDWNLRNLFKRIGGGFASE